jgi:phosphoribosylglycinamide formyltransferase-1
MTMRQEIIVLATGERSGGGTGFEKHVEYFNHARRRGKVVGVVSNIRGGGVEERARRLSIPFMHLPNEACTEEGYRNIAPYFVARDPWYSSSGWMRLIKGLLLEKTVNIHPALLSQLNGRFGGKGMYKHHIHQAVKQALDEGFIDCSGFTMHFVDDSYDRGPVFAEVRVPLLRGMSADDIRAAVNAEEHRMQPRLLELVLNRRIRLLRGRVIVPEDYQYLPVTI